MGADEFVSREAIRSIVGTFPLRESLLHFGQSPGERVSSFQAIVLLLHHLMVKAGYPPEQVVLMLQLLKDDLERQSQDYYRQTVVQVYDNRYLVMRSHGHPDRVYDLETAGKLDALPCVPLLAVSFILDGIVIRLKRAQAAAASGSG